MNIDYTVTALMFPAIPLIMGVYSNRFHSLSALIRNYMMSMFMKNMYHPNGKNSLLI